MKGWINDTRYHLARDVSPDWEWGKLDNWFASHILLAVQGANWQRAHGKASDRPKRITPQLLRGDEDESQVSKSGVRSGRRRGRGIEITSASDLGSVKERMRERRKSASK